MLAIDPDQCIDCGVCVPECPAEAIFPEADVPVSWVEINRKHAKEWPNITKKKNPPEDAEKFDGVKGKYEKFIVCKDDKI